MNLCTLLPIVVGIGAAILGTLLGWLISQRKVRSLDQQLQIAQGDYNEMKEKYKKKGREYDTVSSQFEASKSNYNQLRLHHSTLSEEHQLLNNYYVDLELKYDALLAKQGISNTVPTGLVHDENQMVILPPADHKDDLKKIEGIGPMIEKVLNKVGIYTWEELAQRDSSTLKSILNEAGKKFSIHDPATWPKQAELAASEDWETLVKWQDELDGGKEKQK